MQRLSLLLLGLAIAWFGARLAAGELFEPYLLRDTLLLVTFGGLTFAFNAKSWQAPGVFRRRRGLPHTGQILLLTGLFVLLGGGLGLALGLEGIGGLAATIASWLGSMLLLLGAWWPGAAVEYSSPQVRWGKDKEGNFVPRAASTAGEPPGEGRRLLGLAMRRRSWLVWLCLLLLAGGILRFWSLEQLPPGCIDRECDIALQLMTVQSPLAVPAAPGSAPTGTAPIAGTGAPALSPAKLGLDEALAGLFLRLTGSGVLGLRLAAALLGWLTVLVLAVALRRLAAPPAALVGAALLAFSPWHLWAGRSSDPSLATALLVAVTLWLGLEALARRHVRWWAPWGVAAGLLMAQAPSLWSGVGLWVLIVTAMGAAQALRSPERVGANEFWRWPLVGLAAAAGVALPVLAGSFADRGVPELMSAVFPPGELLGTQATALLQALLHPEASAFGPLAQSGLLTGVLLALVACGLAALLRHVRQFAAVLVLSGAGCLAWAALTVDLGITAPDSVLLPILPLLIAMATVAVDRVLTALLAAWGPPLVPSARLLTTAALVLVITASAGAFSLMLGLDAVSGAGGGAVEADMARYVSERLRQAPGSTIIVPRAVIDHPSVQLLAGSALAEGRLQPLELGRTLPYTGLPGSGVVYLLPLLDTEVIGLLRQLYPTGEAATELNPAGDRALFNRYSVSEADLRAAQTLQMEISPADPAAAATFFAEPQAISALDFAWAAAPPSDLPFLAEWSGSLVVPETGTYRISVDSSGTESTFTLLLDDILLLDSSLGMREQQQVLSQGIYHLELSYRSGNQPGDLRVLWQGPDGGEEALAAPLLHFPALLDQGLFGDYYANERFEGNPFTTHKDPVIGLDPGLPQPYSVRWHGLLAAPRAGEYLIGADASGYVQIVVAGQTLADNRTQWGFDAPGGVSRYTEGLIYLTSGWHPIEVRYSPSNGASTGGANSGEEAASGLHLLWQPPGSEPSALSGRYLLPAYGVVEPVDAVMPPAPPLVDEILGDDSFALSRASEVWQPHLRVPPGNLPPLPMEQLWQAGGTCGSAPEQFDSPHGIAFSPAGDVIYVADTLNRRIMIYSIDGALQQVVTSNALQEPVDVAVTALGEVLVLDAETQQILRLGAGGSLETVPVQTSFYRPRGLGVDSIGNVLVADTGGARVALIEPNGNLAGEFGGQGSLVGRGQPVDALVVGSTLWAISAEDGRLWNLNIDGSLTAVQPTGTVDGPHLAQLAGGRLLATDPSRGTFILYSERGEPIGQFAYAGELVTPTGIAATELPSGNIIAVADTRACSLSVWRLAQ